MIVVDFLQEGTSNGAADETKMAEQHLSAVMKRESDVNGLEPPQLASSAADVAHHAVQVARQSKEKRSAFMLFCSLQRNSVQEKFIEVSLDFSTSTILLQYDSFVRLTL